MISKNKTLDKVYTARNQTELMNAYKDWAGEYESDTVGNFGYVAHEVVVNRLHEYLADPFALVLDVGCGTGLVGEVLKSKGYSNIDGLDYSMEMLDVARTKGVYSTHLHADLSLPLNIADNSYDAVISAGTFSYGHVKATAFDELARITRAGGFITVTIREGAYEDHDYPEKMKNLEERAVWKALEIRNDEYLKEENVTCKVCTFKVL